MSYYATLGATFFSAFSIAYIIFYTRQSSQTAIQEDSDKNSDRDKSTSSQINTSIRKNEAKIVDSVPCGEIENIAEFKDGKLVMCRCWKSKTFPYCDGAHNLHNKATGDNIGPLIIKK
jgi:CDGSH-type Zn-finger protein